MKKTQLIVNIVLGAAIVALFAIQFSHKTIKTGYENNTAISRDTLNVKANKIAYVNIDTVFSNYEMYNDMSAEFEQKTKTAQAELSSREKKLMEGAKDLEYKAGKGLITRIDAQKRQEELMQEEQELMQLRQQLEYQLAEENSVLQRQLIHEIMQYLKEHNSDRRYTYIFANNFGGNILYSDPALNITWDVIEGLNKKYLANKKK